MSDAEKVYRSYLNGAIVMIGIGLINLSIPLIGGIEKFVFAIGLLSLVISFKFFPSPLWE